MCTAHDVCTFVNSTQFQLAKSAQLLAVVVEKIQYAGTHATVYERYVCVCVLCAECVGILVYGRFFVRLLSSCR